MTGNGNQISGHNGFCVTYYGRGDRTAHVGIKIVKIPTLQPLINSLFDSERLENLNFDIVQVRHGE